MAKTRRQTARELLEVLEHPETSPLAAPGPVAAKDLVCTHPAHSAKVAVHRIDVFGEERWTVELSVHCSLCGSQLLFDGKKTLLLDATHRTRCVP
jgi:hypothetical protein